MYYYLLLVLPFVVMSLRAERTKTMIRIRSLVFSDSNILLCLVIME